MKITQAEVERQMREQGFVRLGLDDYFVLDYAADVTIERDAPSEPALVSVRPLIVADADDGLTLYP